MAGIEHHNNHPLQSATSSHSGGNNSRLSRRDFLKLMAAAGTVMTFTPFVDWGKFLPNPAASAESKKTIVELRDGSHPNIYTFPVNHAEAVIYPKTDDPVLNQEAFRTWQFIRPSKELGGDKNDASAFRVYSMVCLHLWCLWKHVPIGPSKEDPSKIVNGNGQCPYHGSMYDPLTGKAYEGPAARQAPPVNVLPPLSLRPTTKETCGSFHLAGTCIETE